MLKSKNEYKILYFDELATCVWKMCILVYTYIMYPDKTTCRTD